jgi:hypothetical protein
MVTKSQFLPQIEVKKSSKPYFPLIHGGKSILKLTKKW